MKKFIAVFDGFKFSGSTLEYAIRLARAEDAHLLGVFLDDFFYRSYSVPKVVKTQKDYETAIKVLDEKDKKKRDESVIRFQKACNISGIRYSVHRDKNIAIRELKHECMFADLVIIYEHETLARVKEVLPTRFIRELLYEVPCPVLVVPEKYKPVDRLVLLYDGAPSSLYACKMFSYLLDSYSELPVEVLTIKGRDNTMRLPDNKLMREFMKRHFPKANYTVKKGNPEEQIVAHLRTHKGNELVVLGAYRRSELSRWFKASMADILMKQLDTPLFIAHNK